MKRRWNSGAVVFVALLTLLAFGSAAAYAQIQDFGTGGPQVTPHENRTSPEANRSGQGAGMTSGTGGVPGGGGGEMSGTAQGSSGPGAGNERGVLYTLLPWLFVLTLLGGAFSWLKGARGRRGQEEVPVAEGAAPSVKKH